MADWYSVCRRASASSRWYIGCKTSLELERPNIDDLDEASFRAALGFAAQRSTIRKQEAKYASSVSSKASPGKLKDNRKWNKWITGFENMLSTILVVNWVPLSYVVRENPEPTPEGHNTFVQKCIACAPLTGSNFEADVRILHQLATSFTLGEILEQWIKNACKKKKWSHIPRSVIRAL